jgi:hypothetical protein
MLTEEQIKNLKPGDIIYLNNYPITFCDTSYDKSNISARDDASKCGDGDHCWFTREYLTMKHPPKYDPCRLFQKGDEVTPKEVNGRHPGNRGAIFRVCQDEAESGREIKLTMDGHIGHITIDAAYLELVTPVEELESFGVRYSTDRDCAEVYHRRYKNTVAAFYCKCGITREQAEEHAEAERDRLNAEHRKDHDND